MAKRSARRLSKKGLIGLSKQREVIYDEDGKAIKSKLARDENNNIIWLYNGEKFPYLRSVITKYHLNLLNIGI